MGKLFQRFSTFSTIAHPLKLHFWSHAVYITKMQIGMSSWGQQKQGRNAFSMELQSECFYNCILMLPFLYTSRVLFFFCLPLIETISRKTPLILMIFNITYLYFSIQDPFRSVNVRITIALFPSRDYGLLVATVQTLICQNRASLISNCTCKIKLFIAEEENSDFE